MTGETGELPPVRERISPVEAASTEGARRTGRFLEVLTVMAAPDVLVKKGAEAATEGVPEEINRVGERFAGEVNGAYGGLQTRWVEAKRALTARAKRMAEIGAAAATGALVPMMMAEEMGKRIYQIPAALQEGWVALKGWRIGRRERKIEKLQGAIEANETRKNELLGKASQRRSYARVNFNGVKEAVASLAVAPA